MNSCSVPGQFTDNALLAAHQAATWPRNDAPAQLVIMKAGPDSHLGTWADAADLAARTEGVFGDLGIALARAPLERPVQSFVANKTLPGTSVISLEISEQVLASNVARHVPAAVAVWKDLQNLDAAPGIVALGLARDLGDKSRTPATLLTTARQAAMESSVVARRTLEQMVADGIAAAAVARSNAGIFLVVAARQANGFVVGAFPIDLAAPLLASAPAIVASLNDCVPVLEKGGICISKAGP
jgi:hypothetical protein